MAKAIMLQGTASGVGKTILTMALCRILKQDGYRVAPFKAQNMTANTALTASGGEIALSQLLQAYAAGSSPCADMNPIVLKPLPGQQGNQVILSGKLYCNIGAYRYRELKKTLMAEVLEAYARLAGEYDVIVIEGAGSPAELNLKQDDIVNMGLAKRLDVPVLLVADIDRGGVFAALSGTVKLLDPEEQELIKALIINRFRGEAAYFQEGREILQSITGRPVLGLIPYMQLNLPEEDSLYHAEHIPFSAKSDFDSQFDLLADTVRKSLDMELFFRILSGGAGGRYE